MSITGERRLLFVGSGFSINLGMYSWERLFKIIAKNLTVENRVDILLRGGDAYAAADLLSAHLGRRILENRIRKLIRTQQQSISKQLANSWIVPLSRIASRGGIITTNWDTLLTDITGWDALHWPHDRARFIAALKASKPFVLFLHGNVQKKYALVVTQSDRVKVAKMLERSENDLSKIMAIHDTVVLGFGFRDPHVENLFLAAERFSGDSNRLLVFIKDSEVAGFKATHSRLARRYKAQPFPDYDALHSCVTRLASVCDPTASLLRLPDVLARADFFDIVSNQPYGFRTAERLRTDIKKHPRMLDWSAEYLMQNKWTDRHAGTFAVVLSGLMNRWSTTSKVEQKLDQRCRAALNDPAQIGVLEPVAFGLAYKRLPAHQAAFLKAVVQEPVMRRAHVQQTIEYYAEAVEQVGAIKRHMADARRNGIMRANDTGRLLTLLECERSDVIVPVLPLLDRSVRVLEHEGEYDLAYYAKREINRIRSQRGIDPSGIVHK